MYLYKHVYMKNPVQKYLQAFLPNVSRLFLLDGLGALLSAFFLGIVLVRFEAVFGMPGNTLHFLAIVAGVFAVFSLTMHFRTPNNWRPYLMAIAVVNLLYCCLTIALVIFYQQQLTLFGIGYFLLEIMIILILVWIELTYPNWGKG